MRVAFHLGGFGLRGTEVAVFDYAYYNRELLGNESVIVAPSPSAGFRPEVYARFAREFPIRHYSGIDGLRREVAAVNADVLYCLKAGYNDGIALDSVKTCVHAVFRSTDFHGHVYAYISDWLAEQMTEGNKPAVPHIVHLQSATGDYRAALGIPSDAIVFGRHGGDGTFNIPFVHETLRNLCRRRQDIYFLFMNTRPILRSRWLRYPLRVKNLIYLEPSVDLYSKALFVNTCDAMLHARIDGETFGLAVAEFSIRNKPVFTYSGSEDRAHIDILGKKGIYYAGAEELTKAIEEFRPVPGGDWDAYSHAYSPAAVMSRFREVFLS